MLSEAFVEHAILKGVFYLLSRAFGLAPNTSRNYIHNQIYQTYLHRSTKGSQLDLMLFSIPVFRHFYPSKHCVALFFLLNLVCSNRLLEFGLVFQRHLFFHSNMPCLDLIYLASLVSQGSIPFRLSNQGFVSPHLRQLYREFKYVDKSYT